MVSLKILIVEDEEHWQNTLKRLFKRLMVSDSLESIEVASNHEEAYKFLEEGDFSLAITDIYLENDMLSEWYSLAEIMVEKNIPIIVLSGHLDIDIIGTMVNGYDVIGIFSKATFQARKFQERVRRILNLDSTPLIPPSLRPVTLTWLHLSDLHLSDDDNYDRDVVIEALWRDLERCSHWGIEPDVIFFTGDIAKNGQEAEYNQVSHFFDRLLEQTQLPKTRLFVIPGNHDVDWSKISDSVRRVSSFSDHVSLHNVLNDDDAHRMVMRRFEGYTNFVDNYFSGIEYYQQDDYSYAHNFQIREQDISVAGINSSLFSGNSRNDSEKVTDKGNLAISEKQIRNALVQLEPSDAIRIALIHHPLEYLMDFDKREVGLLLRRNFQFVLRGHLHAADIERSNNLQGELVVIPAGSIYQGRDLVNAYNFVQLDIEQKKGKIIFRQYSDTQQEWFKDLDATGEERDGKILFDMNREHAI